MLPTQNLTISIVTYFSDLHILSQLLQSLDTELKSLDKTYCPLKLFLIDNSIGTLNISKPTTAEYREALSSTLSQYFSFPYELIFNNKNLGFSKGHNIILKKILTGEINPKFHLVLNPDVIIHKNALKNSLEFMLLHKDIGLITPNSTYRIGEKEYLCKRYPSLIVLLARGIGSPILTRLLKRKLYHYEMRDLIRDRVYCNIEITSGCFMFLRVEAIRDVGLFDERFFLYFEDFDYSLRMSKKWRICYHPEVKITHFGGFTGRKPIIYKLYFVNSLLKFFNKHGWKIL